jgi:hypothetical protein
MPSKSLAPIKKTFLAEVARQRRFIAKAQKYQVPVGRQFRALKPAELESIAEMVFLRMFLAWEHFLEQSFLSYMCGRKDRKVKIQCFVVFPSIQHAANLIIPEGRRYAEWSEPEIVRQRAERYFKDGEPFKSALGGVSGQVEEMRKVRNSIAHKSKHAREKFEQVVRQALGTVPRGITPGAFLLRRIAGPRTNFETYSEVLTIASTRIIS